MWLLENHDAFGDRRRWLRPGKKYLVGRTAAEAGQLAMSHSTISRKHLTITVLSPADAEDPSSQLASRSRLAIADLATKLGTVVNGHQLKGSSIVVDDPLVEIYMGKCPSPFRICWHPLVFTFSFTDKELSAQPLPSLRRRFDSLDVRIAVDYNIDLTTHVVSRKRNTAKSLQALINGRHLVGQSFIDALLRAAEPPGGLDGAEPSPLEEDFGRHWPDPMQHLPPPGGEPVQHPDSIYAPDPGRRAVLDGYTFVFYHQAQYDNLRAPILNAGGKALLQVVEAGVTLVEDFVRYFRQLMKGDGPGPGVVLVRYLPTKGGLIDWYTDFFTSVSLQLDHRPMAQNEFLEAVLVKDASILRRPLELESSMPEQGAQLRPSAPRTEPEAGTSSFLPPPSSPPMPRTRRPLKRRFAGFDADSDVAAEETTNPEASQADEGSLFVSQEPVERPPSQQPVARPSPAPNHDGTSLAPPDDLMAGIAPAAARFKRQRREGGPPLAAPSPARHGTENASSSAPSRPSPRTNGLDRLALVSQRRRQEEAAEAEALRAREELAAGPLDAADLAAIRRLQIVETIEVRRPPPPADHHHVDDRWKPHWDGIKNFKKFRPRGQLPPRHPVRVIVPLVPAHGSAPCRTSEADETDVWAPPTTSTPHSNDDDDEAHPPPSLARGQKRPAPSAVSEARSAKRRPPASAGPQTSQSDESDDELGFRFGRRR